MTRVGNLMHFGQLFKACGNNYFAQIAHILGNFCKLVKLFHFSSEITFDHDANHRCRIEKNVPIVFILPSIWQDGVESIGIETTSCRW